VARNRGLTPSAACRWTIWERLLARAGRVRDAVATGGNASRDSEARCLEDSRRTRVSPLDSAFAECISLSQHPHRQGSIVPSGWCQFG
jgi:hypothetical protein